LKLINDAMGEQTDEASPVSNDGRGLKRRETTPQPLAAVRRPSAMTGVD